MPPKDDQLAVLRRLRSEGRISDAEYDRLTGGIHSPVDSPVVEAQGIESDKVESAGVDEPVTESSDETSGAEIPEMDDSSLIPPIPPKLQPNLSPNFIGAVLLAGFALVVLAMLGAISWWVAFPAILVLITTLFEGWRAVTIGGALLVAAILVVGLAVSAGGSPSSNPQVTAATLPPNDPFPPVPGSLGFYMEQLPDLWNEVSGPPQITRGLTRHNEIGEYDTFIYRFGEWGRVAGAYDPSNDAIYALLVAGQFSGDGTEQLYLRLCHLVAAYSPECIQSYQETGLVGLGLADFADEVHESEWAVGETTWRLEIEGNVLTIRVYGPDAA